MSTQLSGNHYKIELGAIGAEMDDSINSDISNHEASSWNARHQLEQSEAEREEAARYDAMMPLEKLIYLQQKHYAVIKDLIQKHRDACDDVESFTALAESEKVKAAGEFINKMMHPAIRRIYCRNIEHFNELLESGEFYKDGYKFVKQELPHADMGMVSKFETDPALIQLGYSAAALATPKTVTAICIPAEINSLHSFANTPECKEYAEKAYKQQLDRLIRLRDRAAIAKEQRQALAKAEWDAVEDFTDLFSAVKKSKK